MSDDKPLKKVVKPSPPSSTKKERKMDADLKTPSRVKKEVKVKKEDEDDLPKAHKLKKESVTEDVKTDIRPKSVKVKDEEANDAATSTSKKRKAKDDENKDRKPKKVYDLPGQKHDPPEERDPLRIFYESLYEQRPESEMAQLWMMEHGLLSPADAKKVFEKKQKKQQQGKVGTPVKPERKNADKPVPEVSSKSKKKKINLSDSDDDLIIPKKKVRKSEAV
eukprot:TRINITY_DN3407_c0_g1_i1.p1 TRINITY_DN3407_c0_g1~~TRINITY_DN3407_c0_g1_i1.p1  ORF type:complete len:221 (+),score=70.68 TRINITY_DN3407_c0_g1_i1:183-845(+)